MSGTSEITLKVTAEELKAISGQVENQIDTMRRHFDEVGNIVKRSANYWEAEGQSAYIQAYQSKNEAVENALRRFSDNVEKLRIIAGIYEKTESTATQLSNVLADDVIV